MLLIRGGKNKGKDICSARSIFYEKKQNWFHCVVNRLKKLYLVSRITDNLLKLTFMLKYCVSSYKTLIIFLIKHLFKAFFTYAKH